MSLALLGGSGHLGSGSRDDDDLERRAGGAEHLGNDLCGGSIDAASEAVVLAQAATSTASKLRCTVLSGERVAIFSLPLSS
jgi:hypothetical protein